MYYKEQKLPGDLRALALLGYVIIANKQVHSYQMNIVDEYLRGNNILAEETGIDVLVDLGFSDISKEQALKSFWGEPLSVQCEIMYMMQLLARVDNCVDANEAEILFNTKNRSVISKEIYEDIIDKASNDAQNYRINTNDIFAYESYKKQNWFRDLIKNIITFFKHLYFKITKRYIPDEKADYKSIIERCSLIAAEDFKYVKPEYEKLIEESAVAKRDVSSFNKELKLTNDTEALVKECLKNYMNHIDSRVISQMERAHVLYAQKERTVADFTISLIGRTKSGKSTLHAILTEQGKDKIGVGKQRTTRLNRVYQWNLLRVIDTPGIGSAEADGRTDDEIAESVLGESDVICLVVVDDSIQRDVLELLDKVAKYNKPIIILLNHKEGIRQEVKYKRFMENPTKWLTSAGEDSISGHENRIRRYAIEKGYNKLLKIYPVFLLSALMASEEEHKEDKAVLWSSSNIEAFIEQLKKWVTMSGGIKRSQTIIDETVHIFDEAKKELVQAETILDKQIEFVSNRQDRQKIEEIKEVTIDKIEALLESEYSDLANVKSLEFAEMYYKKHGNMSKYWEEFVKEEEIGEKIKQKIEDELVYGQQKISAVVNEHMEDYFINSERAFKLDDIEIKVDVNIKMIFKLAAAAVSILSAVLTFFNLSNPVGWIITIVSIALGFASDFFKSKVQIKQERVEKIYLSVSEKLKQESPEYIEKTICEIREAYNESLKPIYDMFANVERGLRLMKDRSQGLVNTYDESINRLNLRYGLRLYQFAENDYSNIGEEVISSVHRTKDEIIVKVSGTRRYNSLAVDGIAEDIKFKGNR